MEGWSSVLGDGVRFVCCIIVRWFTVSTQWRIPQEGGTKVVKGTTDFYDLGIRRWNGDTQGCECDEEGSMKYAKMLWLTAKFNKRTGELTIIAEPNTQGKKRRLIIDGMVMDNVIDIEVHQGK